MRKRAPGGRLERGPSVAQGACELVIRELGQRSVIAGVEPDLEARLRQTPDLRPRQAVLGRVLADEPRERLPPPRRGPPPATARRPRRGRRAAARPPARTPALRSAGRGSRPRSAAACRRCHQKPCGPSRPAPVRKNVAGQPSRSQQRRRDLEMAREVVVERDRDRDRLPAPAREHRAVELRRGHQLVRSSQVTQMQLQRRRGDRREPPALPTAACGTSDGRRAPPRRASATPAAASEGRPPAVAATRHPAARHAPTHTARPVARRDEPADLGAEPAVGPRLVEVLLHATSALLGEPLRKARLAAEANDRRGERGRVVRGDQQAAHLVGDDIGDAAHARRDHGRPERHRLHEDERRHLARREQQRVRGQQAGGDVRRRPGEDDLPRDIEVACLVAQLGGVGGIGLEPEERQLGLESRSRSAATAAIATSWRLWRSTVPTITSRSGSSANTSRGPGSRGIWMPTGFRKHARSRARRRPARSMARSRRRCSPADRARGTVVSRPRTSAPPARAR